MKALYNVPMKLYYILLSLYIMPVMATDKLLFEASSTPPHLIELYTSEGCSSCPPADAWVNNLSTNKNLWRSFIPLKFHVDYWNYIGWKDLFSSKTYTTRQRAYAKEWNARNIYTPGFVLNGKEWRTFLGRKIPEDVLEKTDLKLKIFKTNQGLKVVYSGNNNAKRYAVNMAFLGSGHSSKITRGENEGKTLHHNFVVLDLKSKSNQQSSGEITFEQPQKDNKFKNFHLVFWLSEIGSQKPLQVVGGDYSI